MSKLWYSITISLALIFSSSVAYFTQYMLFHDIRDTLFYLLQDIAFVPLQVLIVTVILERILSAREKREIIRKINVVISVFYTEVGIKAIALLAPCVKDISSFKSMLRVDASWTEEQFSSAAKGVNAYKLETHSENCDLNLIRDFLLQKKDFMLTMFENTNLLEHDTFTDMLWAVFHLSDELESRENLSALPARDLEHISVDIRRAYQLLVIEWLYYMNHLKKEYPYLFSLAVRKSPFEEEQSVIIQE